MPVRKRRLPIVADTNVFIRSFKLLLATARAGKAHCLLTNDRDLLDLPEASRRSFPFEIRTPQQFLHEWEVAGSKSD